MAHRPLRPVLIAALVGCALLASTLGGTYGQRPSGCRPRVVDRRSCSHYCRRLERRPRRASDRTRRVRRDPVEIARLGAMTPAQAVASLVNYDAIDASNLAPFDESGIWDRGMDPFPPSRAEAVRLARERGEGLGEKVLPVGTQRRLQPVVDKFFYSLTANQIETQRLGLWWANRMLATRRPLEEKLTLFWHGHFSTGENKVRDYRMMLRRT